MRKIFPILFFIILFYNLIHVSGYTGLVDVEFWCSTVSVVGSVGEEISYNLILSYTGSFKFLDVDLSVEDLPLDWSFHFKYSGLEVNSIRLLNDSSIPIELVLDIPVDAKPGEYYFKVVASYIHVPYKSSLPLKVVINPLPCSLNVECKFPAKVVYAGSNVSFDLSVHYNGPPEIFNLTFLNLPEKWSAKYIHNGDEILKLYLKNGDEVDFKVSINVPMDAEPGDYQLRFQIVSSRISRIIDLSIRVVKSFSIKREVCLQVDYPSIDVEVGMRAYFTLTVKNLGNIDETIYLSMVNGSSDWGASFKVSGKTIHGLLIPAGVSRNVVLELSPPAYPKLGKYNFTILASTADGTVYDKVNLTLNVYGGYRLNIYFPEFPLLYFKMNSGESKSFKVTVENTGYLNVTGLYLSFDLPSGDWNVEVTPKKLIFLPPGSSVDFTVKIYASTIVSAGDYFVTVKAVSNEVSSSSKDIRVTITKPVEWGYFGLALAGIAIVIVFIVFRKLGRR